MSREATDNGANHNLLTIGLQTDGRITRKGSTDLMKEFMRYRELAQRKKTPIFALIVSAILLALSGAAQAQSTPKIWKIGVLVSSTKELNSARDQSLRDGLHELGYDEGKNIALVYRFAEGKPDRLPQLARELVDEKPDVIVVAGTAVAVAAKKATSTIPIVVAGAGDLVEAGLIKSYMFPGGNVTGVGRMSPDFFGSRMKLVKEILPKASLIALLSNPKNPGHVRNRKDAELGAQSMGLSVHSATAQSANELDGAIASAAKAGSSALFILTDTLFNAHVSQIAQSALKNRLPAIYDRPDFVDAGGLASYGVNLPDLSRRAAEYVDQIFKGKNPGELTLVQPTKFDLALNVKTANQIGIVIPAEVLQRANKVIR